MRVSHLNNLRALESVLRNGGLRPAAEELGVTPAAVGQQIRTLEAYLGTNLLVRQATGAVPTTRAEQVGVALSRHMAGLGQVLANLQSQENTNRISVSVLPSFAEIWFPRHLASLFSQIPDIDLRLEGSNKSADLFSGEFDFAVRHMGKPAKAYESRVLFADICAPVCTPSFAARYGIRRDSRSLKSVPLAEIDVEKLATSADLLPDMFDWCERFSIEPPDSKSGLMMVNNASGNRLAGAGLAIYLSGLVEVIGALATGEVVLPFGPERIITGSHEFRLIWRKELRLSPVQKKFVRWITERAAEDRALIDRVLAH